MSELNIEARQLCKSYGHLVAVDNLSFEVGAGEVLGFLRRAVDDFDQTVVMVTHDSRLAEQTERTIRIFDGRQVH